MHLLNINKNNAKDEKFDRKNFIVNFSLYICTIYKARQWGILLFKKEVLKISEKWLTLSSGLKAFKELKLFEIVLIGTGLLTV